MAPSTTSPSSPTSLTSTDQTKVSEQPKLDSTTAASSKMQNETIEPGNRELWAAQNNNGTANPHLPDVSIEPEAPKLDSGTVQQYTRDLYEAINGDDPDNEEISHLLESLNAADRKAIEDAYVNTNGNTDHRDLRTELKDNLGEEDYLQAEADLNKRDGYTNDAGNLMVSLSQIDDNRGDAERRVLETFSTLNVEQQQQLQDDFFKDYGKSVDQALEEFDLSDDAMKAVDFVSKPVEQRTAQDIEDFARFAIDKGDLDYFSIAMRGDSPAAVEARQKLSNDEDFKNKIVEAFKVHQDGGTAGFMKRLASAIPGGEVVVGGINLVEGLVKGDLNFDRLIEGTNFDTWKKAIESKEVDSKLLQAMDILKNGQVSLATIAADNTGSIFGWFDNKDAISNAAEHATESERKLFSRGQELAQGGGQPHSEEDKNALDFYNSVHAAFDRAGNDSEPLKWEDRLVNGKDGSIISQFADNNSKEGKYTAVESLSQKDWEKLKDPEQGAAFRKQIETFLAENGGGEEAQAVLALLDQKLAAGTYEDSEKVMRSLSDLVTTSPHSKTAFASIAAISPQEAAKYQADSAFRAQVDQFLKDNLDDLGQVAATRLLSQIATTGKPPEQDAIDKLFSDKLNETEGKDAIANIEAVLQDPALRQKLAGPEDTLNDVEKQLKKTIEGYIDAATPDSPAVSYGRGASLSGSNDSAEEVNEYVQALYQNGRLTVDQKAEINLRGDNFFSDAATVSSEERQKLYDSGLISAEEKQLIDTLTGQGGEMSLADRLRGAVIKDGGDAELFEDELKGLSPEDKQKLKDEYAQKYGSALDEDVLAHVSDQEKNNFRSYLTAGEVDGRQDFYDNLKAALFSESGYSPDGSQEVMERALSTQASMLSDFQARFEKLPPEKQAEANQLFTAALKDYQEGKEACAEKLYQAAVIVGGVAVGVATGGVGLVALASVVAIGAAGRIALKKAIQGNDYELTLSNVLKDGAIGGATAGLSVLGPETFAAFKLVGQNAARTFMTAATPQIEQVLAKQGIRQSVQDIVKTDALAKQLNNVIASSVVRGEPISEQVLSGIVSKVLTVEASAEQRAALTTALTTALSESLSASGRKVVEGMVSHTLSGTVRQAGTYGVLGGTTNVALEGSVAAANGYDLSGEDLLKSFGIGFGAGAGISATFDSVIAASRARAPQPQTPDGIPALERGQMVDSVGFETANNGQTIVASPNNPDLVIRRASGEEILLPSNTRYDLQEGESVHFTDDVVSQNSDVINFAPGNEPPSALSTQNGARWTKDANAEDIYVNEQGTRLRVAETYPDGSMDMVATEPGRLVGAIYNAKKGTFKEIPRVAGASQDDISNLTGSRVSYHGSNEWKIAGYDPATDQVRLTARGFKTTNLQDLRGWNNGRWPTHPQDTFNLMRSDGRLDSGWKVYGRSSDGQYQLYKDDAIETRVSRADLQKENPRLAPSRRVAREITREPEVLTRGAFVLSDGSSIDSVTATMLRRYGLTPDSYVYRSVDPEYLDFENGTIGPNPNSCALVSDPYNKVDLYGHLVYGQKDAIDVGPGLNVAVNDPSKNYMSQGQVLVGIKVDDLLRAGGRVYPDIGAAAVGVRPIYVTFDGDVPFVIIPRDPNGQPPFLAQ